MAALCAPHQPARDEHPEKMAVLWGEDPSTPPDQDIGVWMWKCDINGEGWYCNLCSSWNNSGGHHGGKDHKRKLENLRWSRRSMTTGLPGPGMAPLLSLPAYYAAPSVAAPAPPTATAPTAAYGASPQPAREAMPTTGAPQHGASSSSSAPGVDAQEPPSMPAPTTWAAQLMTLEQRVADLAARPNADIMPIGFNSLEMRVHAVEAAVTKNLSVSDHKLHVFVAGCRSHHFLFWVTSYCGGCHHPRQ